jgi:hypothetical protein
MGYHRGRTPHWNGDLHFFCTGYHLFYPLFFQFFMVLDHAPIWLAPRSLLPLEAEVSDNITCLKPVKKEKSMDLTIIALFTLAIVLVVLLRAFWNWE